MICLGIDPGSRTGLAIVDQRTSRVLALATVDHERAFEAALALAQKHRPEAILIERPCAFGLFRERWRDAASARAAAHIERCVGQCQERSDELVRRFREAGYRVEQVAPGKRAFKHSRAFFEQLTGWKGASSEHSRDAAAIAMRAVLPVEVMQVGQT